MSFDPKYKEDRKFGDKFMPEVKAILGQFLLTGDYDEEDCKRNTDLIVLTMDRKRIGVRIRRHYYFEHYPDDFTIRYSKASGATTEFSKVMHGWGDYFFYGFSDEEEYHLQKWIIGDYTAFRIYITNMLYLYGGSVLERHRQDNPNGDTFLAFKNNEIPKFVVADSEHWKEAIP